MEIKLVIDGEEIKLEYRRTVGVSNGTPNKSGYENWSEPKPYQDLMLGATPLIVSVYKKPGWKPSAGFEMPISIATSGNEADNTTQSIHDNLSQDLKQFDFFLKNSIIGKGPKTEATRRTYLHAIKHFKGFLGEQEPTSELSNKFILNQKNTNNPSSLNTYIAALKSYFSFLGKEINIHRIRTDRGYPPILSEGDWQKLLSIATKSVNDVKLSGYGRFRALSKLCLLYLYCDCGLSPHEAVNIKVADVLDNGYIRITHVEGDFDRVPTGSNTLTAIKDYIRYRNSQEQYLFPGNKQNTHIAYRTAQGIIYKLFKKAELLDTRARNIRCRTIQQLRKLKVSGEEIKLQVDS